MVVHRTKHLTGTKICTNKCIPVWKVSETNVYKIFKTKDNILQVVSRNPNPISSKFYARMKSSRLEKRPIKKRI